MKPGDVWYDNCSRVRRGEWRQRRLTLIKNCSHRGRGEFWLCCVAVADPGQERWTETLRTVRIRADRLVKPFYTQTVPVVQLRERA